MSKARLAIAAALMLATAGALAQDPSSPQPGATPQPSQPAAPLQPSQPAAPPQSSQPAVSPLPSQPPAPALQLQQPGSQTPPRRPAPQLLPKVQVPAPMAPVPEAPPPPAEVTPPPPKLDTALLVKAADLAFVNDAKRAHQAKAFNTDRVALSRARHGAELLISLAPEFVSSSRAWVWAIGVETNPEPIAYCIPGGKIMVTTGFFERMRLTDDEYSALIAHAIAHALLGHDTNAAFADYNRRRGSTEPDPDVNRAAIELAESLNSVVTKAHYDETEERAADAVALDLIARAGINPGVAIDAWRKVMRAGGTSAPAFLAMHPMRADRLAELEAQLPRVMPMYQQAQLRPRPSASVPMRR